MHTNMQYRSVCSTGMKFLHWGVIRLAQNSAVYFDTMNSGTSTHFIQHHTLCI